MAIEEIEVRRTVGTEPAALWTLLDDSESWPDWTPIDSCEIERVRAEAVDELRKFKTGRVTVREEVIDRDPERRLSYRLLRVLAVRHYRADTELTPEDDGTALRWHTTFEAQVPGTGWIYLRAIDAATRKFVDVLCQHAAARG